MADYKMVFYTVTDLGSVGTPWVLTRAVDADANAEVTQGLFTIVLRVQL